MIAYLQTVWVCVRAAWIILMGHGIVIEGVEDGGINDGAPRRYLGVELVP